MHPLLVDRLDELEGNGVYYAPTPLEARLCGPSPVVVVGGGNSAGQAAMFAADEGSAVTLVLRSSDLGKNMSRYLVDRIEAHPRIDVQLNSEVTALSGDGSLSGVQVSSQEHAVDLPCAGLFLLIGADPRPVPRVRRVSERAALEPAEASRRRVGSEQG